MPGIWTRRGTLALSCARGLEPYARREARALGYKVQDDDGQGSVQLDGTLRDAMRLNLWLRTAHRVLFPVAQVEAKTLDHLFAHALEIPWEEWFPPDGFVTVHGTVRNDTIRDTRLPMLRLKDAIVDRLRGVHGRRPDSGQGFHGASVFMLWRRRELRIFIDTTGEPLSRRGYRQQPGAAPMQETLAAACVMASGWDWHAPFVAPMCGSGTPAIEAVMIGLNRAPALLREHFAFMSLQGYREPAASGGEFSGAGDKPSDWWETLRTEARAGERPVAEVPPIVASDNSTEMLRYARVNAGLAGVEQFIRFEHCDFAATPLPPGRGVIFMNPAYGERLGESDALVPLYRRIGEFLGQASDYKGCVLTANPRLAHEIGLQPKRMTLFFNGPLECRLLAFGQ